MNVIDTLIHTGLYAPTDAGNAERIAYQHREDLRYSPGQGWYAWDGIRWRRDDDGAATRAAISSARSIHLETPLIESDRDRKTHAEWAIKSESEHRVRAALALAEAQSSLIVRADQFDADRMLLNVANGALDLRTGELRAHERADLATRMSPTVYEPNARDSAWDEFLKTVTDGDDALASYLQRLVGYSLSGATGEEIVPFLHGPGASGKTTFLEAIRAVAGDYSAVADPRTFMRQRGSAGPRNDLARLRGVRFVVTSEVDEGQEIDASTLKLVTGGDKITARLLYQEYFEFTPQFKLWMMGNSRPRARASDSGLWRRLVEIPFPNAVPEADRDPAVKQRLTRDPDAQAAILVWAVEGALEWQRDGLGESQRSKEATSDYRAEADPVERWLEEECEFGASLRSSLADLHRSHGRWASRNAADAVPPAAIAKALRARGLRSRSSGTQRYWSGVRPR